MSIEKEQFSYEEKNRQLFIQQKNTLDMFLERGAISKAQHDKSLGDLIEKMNVGDLPQDVLSDDERIDVVARRLLIEYKEAFAELAR